MSPRKKQADPIFALIADYAAKAKKKDEAKAKLDALTALKPRHLANRFTTMSLGDRCAIRFPTEIKSYVLSRLKSDGLSYGPKMRRKLLALQKFAQKELEQMLDARCAEHARAREASGIVRVEKSYLEAADAWGDARRRMVKVAPRTPEGAAALAEVIASFEHDFDAKLGTQALARAVAIAAKGESRRP